jgi:hypothetical protein
MLFTSSYCPRKDWWQTTCTFLFRMSHKVYLSGPYLLLNLTHLVVTLIQIIKSPPQGRVWNIGTQRSNIAPVETSHTISYVYLSRNVCSYLQTWTRWIKWYTQWIQHHLKKTNYTSLKNEDKRIRHVKPKIIYSAIVVVHSAVHSLVARWTTCTKADTGLKLASCNLFHSNKDRNLENHHKTRHKTHLRNPQYVQSTTLLCYKNPSVLQLI